jgi:hypothetical protein
MPRFNGDKLAPLPFAAALWLTIDRKRQRAGGFYECPRPGAVTEENSWSDTSSPMGCSL